MNLVTLQESLAKLNQELDLIKAQFETQSKLIESIKEEAKLRVQDLEDRVVGINARRDALQKKAIEIGTAKIEIEGIIKLMVANKADHIALYNEGVDASYSDLNLEKLSPGNDNQ